MLIRLATSHGHELISPRPVGTRGIRDSAHFAYAVRQGVPVLSGNTGDFEALHDLAQALCGQHAGILLVYGERRPRQRMRASQIVQALTRLEIEHVPTTNALIVLNNYR